MVEVCKKLFTKRELFPASFCRIGAKCDRFSELDLHRVGVPIRRKVAMLNLLGFASVAAVIFGIEP